MRRRLDLTGDNYGSLYVVAKCDDKNRKWLCRCECGNTVKVDRARARRIAAKEQRIAQQSRRAS